MAPESLKSANIGLLLGLDSTALFNCESATIGTSSSFAKALSSSISLPLGLVPAKGLRVTVLSRRVTKISGLEATNPNVSKFKLKRAEFSTTSSGTLTLSNATLPTKTLDSNPIRTFNGSGVIRVFHKNHGMHSTNDNVTIAGVASGTYNGITAEQINGTYTSISNITLDSYDITSGGTANATGDVGGATVTATQNRLFDVLQFQIGNVIHPQTNISATMRTTSGKSVHGTESPFGLEAASSQRNVVLGDNIYFTEPRMVASGINETNEMSGSK